MKKSTKKTLMALGIIFIFGMSSIAFVFSGFTQQQEQLKPLDSFVVDGEIDQPLESAYIQNGVTFLKFYYNGSVDSRIASFVDQAPELFTTSAGQLQLIVLKIESPSTYARILNVNGAVDLAEITVDGLYDSLCTALLAPPPECVIGKINSTG